MIEEVGFEVEVNRQPVVGFAAEADVLSGLAGVVDLLLLNPVERDNVDRHVDQFEVPIDPQFLGRIAGRADGAVVVGDQHRQVVLSVNALVERVFEPPVDQELVLNQDRPGRDRPAVVDEARVVRVVRRGFGRIADNAERLELVAQVAADDLVEQLRAVRVEAGDRADDVLAVLRRRGDLRVVDQPQVNRVEVVLDQVELLIGDDRADIFAGGIGQTEDQAVSVEVGQNLRPVAQRGQFGARRQGFFAAFRRPVRLRQNHAVESDADRVGPEDVDPHVHDVRIDVVDLERAVGRGGGEAGVDRRVEPQVVVGIDEDRHAGQGAVALVLNAVGVVVNVDQPTDRPRIGRGAGQQHLRLQHIGRAGSGLVRPLGGPTQPDRAAGAAVPGPAQPAQADRLAGRVLRTGCPRGQSRQRGSVLFGGRHGPGTSHGVAF